MQEQSQLWQVLGRARAAAEYDCPVGRLLRRGDRMVSCLPPTFAVHAAAALQLLERRYAACARHAFYQAEQHCHAVLTGQVHPFLCICAFLL